MLVPKKHDRLSHSLTLDGAGIIRRSFERAQCRYNKVRFGSMMHTCRTDQHSSEASNVGLSRVIYKMLAAIGLLLSRVCKIQEGAQDCLCANAAQAQGRRPVFALSSEIDLPPIAPPHPL
jgi:hypothetical protein